MNDGNGVFSGFPAVGGKPVRMAFDAGRLTSDAGVLLLAEIECQSARKIPRRITAGFHAPEADGTRRWRWTDGHAHLAIPSGCTDRGRAVLDLHAAAAQPSWLQHGRAVTAPGGDRKAA
jgi:hypothetical protein